MDVKDLSWKLRLLVNMGFCVGLVFIAVDIAVPILMLVLFPWPYGLVAALVFVALRSGMYDRWMAGVIAQVVNHYHKPLGGETDILAAFRELLERSRRGDLDAVPPVDKLDRESDPSAN